ncbi:MAG: Bax inhibitor-1/YccA family protein [Silvanigrellaceae bacterium]|nr:Bax inhibitor-1/YccA family protein [Silvanigrellaceae bacterium]
MNFFVRDNFMVFGNGNNNNGNWMRPASFDPSVQQMETSAKMLGGVYGWMAFGVLLSALSGYVLLASGGLQMLLAGGQFAVIAVALVQLGIVIAMSAAANKLSASTLKGMFLTYSALTGVTFAIVSIAYPIGNVIGIFAVAAGAYSALAVFGTVTKKDLSFMATFLMMGLFMVIGMSIVNIFLHSNMLNQLSGWIGIIVFSGLTAYDAQRLRQEAYELNSAAANPAVVEKFKIFGALTMYMNFINLFISLLRVFGGNNRD